MAQQQLRRPSEAMKRAVNASIDGNTTTVNSIIKEYDLDRREIKERIDIRDGSPYDVQTTDNGLLIDERPGKRMLDVPGHVSNADPLELVNENCTTATLLRLAFTAEELLEQRPKSEVKKVERALQEVWRLKAEYEEALALVG